MTYETALWAMGMGVVLAPVMLLSLLGVSALTGVRLPERVVGRSTEAAVTAGLLLSVAILAIMLISGTRYVPIEVGHWVILPVEHFHFHFKFAFDRLSIPFTILSFVLVGTIGAFARHYLHRESGFNRFFLFYAVFLVGMIVATLAGTIETLFLGWELVGLSSALLVAFFHDRRAPVVNGERVWSVYRVADAAFLIAAVALHHLTGEGDFAGLMGTGPWPEGHAALTSQQAFFVGILLLIAAAGKSALIPFSGWLPRAMEGPTPSSAVFYGALSVHLGTFLLLRASPILDLSIWLCACVVAVGVASAIFGALAARVQTDVKSALAFASVTQVGIITAEIGLGFRYVALIHIIGHACLRTLQMVRAPTLLHDYRTLENALGEHLNHEGSVPEDVKASPARVRRYRLALERGYFDSAINEYVIRPFFKAFSWCNRMERRWTNLLAGVSAHDPPPAAPRSSKDIFS